MVFYKKNNTGSLSEDTNRFGLPFLKGNALLNLALFLTAFVFIGLLIIRMLHVQTYIVNLFGIEQDEIYTLQHILAGLPLYSDPFHPPFSITQKTPLYHYVCLFVGWITGTDPEQPYQVYLLNRSVSLFFALGTAGLGGFILNRLLKAPLKLAVILGCVMFLCMEGHMFARPDSLFSLLFLSTIGLNIYYVQTNKVRVLWLTLIMGALTIFVKQSGIVLPVITLAYVGWFQKNSRLVFSGTLVFLVAFALLLVLVKSGDLEIFFSNTFGGINNGISFRWFYDFIYNRAYRKFGLFFILGLFFCWEWMFRKKGTPTEKFLMLALTFSFVFTHLISFKWGSTPSYFSEFVHLCILSIPVYYQGVDSEKLKGKAAKLGFLGLLVLIPIQTSDKRLAFILASSDKPHFERCEKLRTYLYANHPLLMEKWLLTDDELLKLYLYKNALLPQDDITYTMFKQGTFNIRKYHSLLERGQVPLLVSEKQLEEVEANAWYMYNQFTENYRKIKTVEGFHIYKFEPIPGGAPDSDKLSEK